MIYRRYSVPSVFDELQRVQRDMSRVAASFASEGAQGGVFPAINAWTTEEEEIVTAELPGMDPADIDISIVNDVLTISGERKPLTNAEEIRYHRRERVSGSFSRSIQLAFAVDANRVTAGYENGVLKVNLPRAEADKPRKISVQSH